MVGFAGLCLASVVQPVAARRWSSEDFVTYVLAFRLVAIAQPLMTLGMTVSLPRLLPRTDGATARGRYVGSAAALFGVAAIIAAGSGFALPSGVGIDLLGARLEGMLRAGLILMIIGAAGVAVCAALLRGLLCPSAAAVIHYSGVALVPLLAVVIASSAVQALLGIGIALCVLAVGIGAVLVYNTSGTAARANICELAVYGSRRLPGELSLFGMFALTPILMLQVTKRADAGVIAVGCSLVTLAGAVFALWSDATVASLSKELYHRASQAHQRVTGRCYIASAVCAFGSVVAFFVSRPLLSLYLGGSIDVPQTVRIVAASAGPFAAYVILRSAVDAFHTRPMTMRYALLAVLPFTAVVATGLAVGSPSLIGSALLGAMLVLFALTLRDACNIASRSLLGSTGHITSP